MSSGNDKKRKVTSIISPADYAELERHHRFLPSQPTASSTWQDRMVHHYHQHLYQDYVLADLSRATHGQLGLRWRTQTEVQAGKGSETCGNKHCPSHQQETTKDGWFEREALSSYLKGYDVSHSEKEERALLKKLPYGILITNLEVPFTYQEDNQNKTELVKLRLCARCAPHLFVSKGESSPSVAARRARSNRTETLTTAMPTPSLAGADVSDQRASKKSSSSSLSPSEKQGKSEKRNQESGDGGDRNRPHN
jgi:protein FRA10AC1